MIALLLSLILAATGIARDVDPALVQSAQARAETVVCRDPSSFFGHVGKPDGVYEVLHCVTTDAPIAQGVVNAWMNSTAHRNILMNGSLRHIGCAAHDYGNGWMFVCHLAPGVPNTALPLIGMFTSIGVLFLFGGAIWLQQNARKRRLRK